MVLCNETTGREFSECSVDPPADSIWILTSTFIIFTMQSGFGLLESGSVSAKNEVNIMVKNAVDVICGGMTYWMFGYGFSFGDDEPYTNAFCGWGKFFVEASEEELGWVYSKFFFQASFATTATTIVSGAMAERTKLESYIVFSLLNTFVYCFPAHWIWGSKGWLQEMGVIDIAGAGPVHMVGGISGLVATIVLKPRHNRYKHKKMPQMGSPTNALLGMFMLWWGWLGFNCGSTFGISGLKWKLAARSAVSTISASIAGGFIGLLSSYIVKKRMFDVAYLINGILGSLVAITATCAMVHPWEGIIIGIIGGLVTIGGVTTLDKFHIDDPVGCVGTHALGGAWSMIAAGFFARKDSFAKELHLESVHNGLFNGGGFYQLGVQTLAVVSLIVWTTISSFFFLKIIDLVMGLRVPLEEEILGADIVEHGIGNCTYDKHTKKLIADDEDDDIISTNVRERRHSHAFGRHTDALSSLAALTLSHVTGEQPDSTPSPIQKSRMKRFINKFSKKSILKSKRAVINDNHVHFNGSVAKDTSDGISNGGFDTFTRQRFPSFSSQHSKNSSVNNNISENGDILRDTYQTNSYIRRMSDTGSYHRHSLDTGSHHRHSLDNNVYHRPPSDISQISSTLDNRQSIENRGDLVLPVSNNSPSVLQEYLENDRPNHVVPSHVVHMTYI